MTMDEAEGIPDIPDLPEQQGVCFALPVCSDKTSKLYFQNWHEHLTAIACKLGLAPLMLSQIVPWYTHTVPQTTHARNWLRCRIKVAFLAIDAQSMSDDLPWSKLIGWEILFDQAPIIPVLLYQPGRNHHNLEDFQRQYELVFSQPILLVDMDAAPETWLSTIEDHLDQALKQLETVLPLPLRQAVAETMESIPTLFVPQLLKLFHQEPSAALFYSAIETAVFYLHFLVLFHAIRHDEIDQLGLPAPGWEDNKVHKVLSKKTDYVEGKLMVCLRALMDRYPDDQNLQALSALAPLDSGLAAELRTLLKELDSGLAIRSKASLVDLFDVLVNIRNLTKGHGNFYQVDAPVISTIVRLTLLIIQRIWQGSPFVFHSFADDKIDTAVVDFHYDPQSFLNHTEMINHTHLVLEPDHIDLYPGISYTRDFGLNLFAGYSDPEGNSFLYKNYTMGNYYQVRFVTGDDEA